MTRLATAIMLVSTMSASRGPAQLAVEAELVAASTLLCEVRSPTANQRQTLPPGTDLSRGARLNAGITGQSATTTVAMVQRGDGIRVTIADEVVVATRDRNAWSSCGRHETRLTLRAVQPTTVRLVLSVAIYGSVDFAPWEYVARADIGDDGSFEFAASRGSSRRIETVVTIDASGLPIRTQTLALIPDSSGSFRLSASGHLVVEVLPLDAILFDLRAATSMRAQLSPWFMNQSSLPAQSVLWPRTVLSTGNGATQDWALTEIDALREPQRILFTFNEQGSVSLQSTNASVGTHDMLMTLRCAVPRELELSLTATARASPMPLTDYRVQVDIGDDGRWELVSQLSQTVAVVVPVIADSAGIRVRVRSFGMCANPGASFTGSLTIEAKPRLRCRVTPYGSACGIALAGDVGLEGRLVLALAGAPPNSPGKLLLGFVPVDLPLPFSPCRLYTDVYYAGFFVTDGAGRATHFLNVPRGRPLTFNVQDVLAIGWPTNVSLIATNGVRVECP